MNKLKYGSSPNHRNMKKTDKLTKTQVMKIPKLLPKKSVGEVAKMYNVSWQAVWYWVKRLRVSGVEVKTKKQGSYSKII